MATRLNGLKASSVRGIPRDWPELPIGEKGMIVSGPNGVGKSSIVDALEYGLRGTSSLYPAQRQGVNWDAGAPHVRHGDPNIEVELLCDTKPVGLVSGHDPGEFTGDVKAWIEAARNANFVLRRHMLLEFIIAQPRPRYERIEAFMNLGRYLEIENALKDWVDQVETDLKAADADVTKIGARLRAIFELKNDAEIDEGVLLGCLNEVLQDINFKNVREKDELETRRKEVAGELGGEEQNVRLAALGALKNELQQLGLPQELVELLNGFVAALVELERETKSRTQIILTDLLLHGKEVIETSILNECPLCEQAISRDAVLARLKERIAADERITVARNLVGKRHRELLPRINTLLTGYNKFNEQWQEHMNSPPLKEYSQSLVLLKEIIIALRSEKRVHAQFNGFEARLKAAIASHAEAMAQIDAKIAECGGGMRRSRLASAESMIKSILSDWPKYVADAIKARNIAKRKELVGNIHTHAIGARKAAVRATFDRVAGIANNYYERMHPDEGIATSKLEVRVAGQGSASLSTEFYGTREHPLLHYSESHLDTLGLSYFLALRKYEATLMSEFKVLVLDDVMHSVDAEHRARVARVIKEEFGDHQVIITTHDGPFYDALRRNFGNENYTYYQINNWNLERGPVLGDPLTDFDRIVDPNKRETQGLETLAAAGGRFFEWLLRETTEALDVAIPARFKRRVVIGDMWPPLAKKLKKQKGYATKHFTLVDGLEQNGWVRNECGAHYNEGASAPSLPEVQEFAKLLAALHTSMRCEVCREFISKHSNGLWKCGCGRISYGESVPKTEGRVS